MLTALDLTSSLLGVHRKKGLHSVLRFFTLVLSSSLLHENTMAMKSTKVQTLRTGYAIVNSGPI